MEVYALGHALAVAQDGQAQGHAPTRIFLYFDSLSQNYEESIFLVWRFLMRGKIVFQIGMCDANIGRDHSWSRTPIGIRRPQRARALTAQAAIVGERINGSGERLPFVPS